MGVWLQTRAGSEDSALQGRGHGACGAWERPRASSLVGPQGASVAEPGGSDPPAMRVRGAGASSVGALCPGFTGRVRLKLSARCPPLMKFSTERRRTGFVLGGTGDAGCAEPSCPQPFSAVQANHRFINDLQSVCTCTCCWPVCVSH